MILGKSTKSSDIEEMIKWYSLFGFLSVYFCMHVANKYNNFSQSKVIYTKTPDA